MCCKAAARSPGPRPMEAMQQLIRPALPLPPWLNSSTGTGGSLLHDAGDRGFGVDRRRLLLVVSHAFRRCGRNRKPHCGGKYENCLHRRLLRCWICGRLSGESDMPKSQLRACLGVLRLFRPSRSQDARKRKQVGFENRSGAYFRIREYRKRRKPFAGRHQLNLQSLRSATSSTRWSAPLRRMRSARGRVGRMFSRRFFRLMLFHRPSAIARAASSDSCE